MSNTRAAADGTRPAVVQSVDRAVSVLEVLASRREAGVTEIAAVLGVHKSTAFRLVSALEHRGLVEQTVSRGSYRLGVGLIRLAGAAASGLDLTQQSQPVCERLAQELGETVNVAVLEGDGVINISQVRGTAAVTSHNWVGRNTPAHATSSGKILLAYADRATLDQIAARRRLEQFTPRTLGTPKQLVAALDEARARGWASTVEEYELGLNAVAAPIRDLSGNVVAALSVSGPSYRFAEDRLPEVAARVATAAIEISSRLGHV